MKCERCGEVNPAEIHTCTPKTPINVNGVLEQAGYIKKKEWQGLTDEEILADDVLRYHFALNGGAGPISKKGMAVIAALEAKLKEKNT